MQRSIYLRPLGAFATPPEAGEEAMPTWRGLPLAGSGLSFAAVEIIERDVRGVRRTTAALGDMFERDWGRHTLAASDMLEASSPRARLGGLALDRPRIIGNRQRHPGQLLRRRSPRLGRSRNRHGMKLVADGADILDIGGESTRPGSDAVPVEEELGASCRCSKVFAGAPRR